MKIAIVNAHYSHILGGSEMQCHQIAEGLTAMNKDVVYIAVGGYDDDRKWPYKLSAVEKNAQAVIKACKALKPDVVYWRYNKNFLSSVADDLKKLGIRLVFSVSHIHDLQPFAYKPIPDLGLLMRVRRRAGHIVKGFRFQKAFKTVDGVICNNEEHLRHIRHQRKIYIPNSPFLEAQSFEWPRPYVVWVGSIKAHKHPDMFIDLAKSLSGLGVDFLMIGAIQQQAFNYVKDSNKLPANFHYLGAKDPIETNGIIKSSLFLVHTCEPEGFPNVFLQAWGFSKPTISMQFDPAGLLAKERVGIHSGNYEQMVADCERWVKQPDELEPYGARASAYVKKHFVKSRNLEELLSFLSLIVQK